MKKSSILNVFLMFLTILSFTFNNKAKAEDGYQLFDKVVLVVNGEPCLLKSDLEFAKNWYNIKDDKEAEEKIINSLLLAQQARRMGISVSPQEVDKAVLNIAKANGIDDLETFKKKLEDSGISYSKLKEFLARDMLANRLLHLYMREKASKGIIEGTKEDVKTVRLIFISKNRPDYQEVLSKLNKELNKIILVSLHLNTLMINLPLKIKVWSGKSKKETLLKNSTLIAHLFTQSRGYF
jgi:SurA N-terminal domain.